MDNPHDKSSKILFLMKQQHLKILNTVNFRGLFQGWFCSNFNVHLFVSMYFVVMYIMYMYMLCFCTICSYSGGSRGGSRGSLKLPSLIPLFLNIPWKWNNLVSVRPNYFIFMKYLRKNRWHQQSEPPHLYTYEPIFQKSSIRPCFVTVLIPLSDLSFMLIKICSVVIMFCCYINHGRYYHFLE